MPSAEQPEEQDHRRHVRDHHQHREAERAEHGVDEAEDRRAREHDARDLVAGERVGAAVQHHRVAGDLDVEPRLEPQPRDLLLDPRDQPADRARAELGGPHDHVGRTVVRVREAAEVAARRHEDEVGDLLARVGDALLGRDRRARARGSAASARRPSRASPRPPGPARARAAASPSGAGSRARGRCPRRGRAARRRAAPGRSGARSRWRSRAARPSARRRRSGSRCRPRSGAGRRTRPRSRAPSSRAPSSSGARTRPPARPARRRAACRNTSPSCVRLCRSAWCGSSESVAGIPASEMIVSIDVPKNANRPSCSTPGIPPGISAAKPTVVVTPERNSGRNTCRSVASAASGAVVDLRALDLPALEDVHAVEAAERDQDRREHQRDQVDRRARPGEQAERPQHRGQAGEERQQHPAHASRS